MPATLGRCAIFQFDTFLGTFLWLGRVGMGEGWSDHSSIRGEGFVYTLRSFIMGDGSEVGRGYTWEWGRVIYRFDDTSLSVPEDL